MDELDIRILRELTQAGTVLPARPGLRASYRNIARALSVSPGTVRNRVNRMYSDGVITGSSVYANPNLLGIEAGAYAVEVSSQHRKREVLERLRALEGVYFLQNFRGTLVGIAFAYGGDRSRTETIAAIHRITGAKTGVFSRVLYPPCNLMPSRSEWKLVSRLVRGPFRDYTTLARELKVSVRTVKRRISKLVHAHAVLSVPTMDYRALSGCVPVDLLVAFTSPETRPEAEREIFRRVGNQMVYAGVWADMGMYSLLLPRLSSATQLGEQVPEIPGVRMARAEIVEEHIDLIAALRKYADRQWAPPPPSAVRKATAAG